MMLLCLNMGYSIFISLHWCLYLEEEKSNSYVYGCTLTLYFHWKKQFVLNMTGISIPVKFLLLFFKVLYVLIKVNSLRKRGRDPKKIVWNKFESYTYYKYYFKELPQTNISYAYWSFPRLILRVGYFFFFYTKTNTTVEWTAFNFIHIFKSLI